MNDSAPSEGRLPAAVSLLLGCVGLGWLLMAAQTSAGHDADVVGEAQRCVEMTAASEPAPVSPRPDGEGRQLATVQLATVMMRED